MNSYNIDITAVSENAVLLEWPEVICETQHQHILLCKQQVLAQYADKIIDVIASYNSLMIYYHFEQLSLSLFVEQLRQITRSITPLECSKDASNIVEIPVCYHPTLGLDIENVAQQTKCSTEQIINMHSEVVYTAFALGFTPGFCYLGTLAPALQLPRRATPRISVPVGAVAIAEQQTAVYPTNSPGGWHIIGQTPVAMYQTPKNEFMPKIAVGQQVKFTPISLNEYREYNDLTKRRATKQ